MSERIAALAAPYVERNARHGLQLSQEDKREVAQRIYGGTPMEERGAKKQRLAHLLSVDLSTVQKWLSKTDGDDKERRDVTAFNLWLACHTQEEIAARLGISQQAVAKLPFLQPDGNFRFVVKVGLALLFQNGNFRFVIESRPSGSALPLEILTPPCGLLPQILRSANKGARPVTFIGTTPGPSREWFAALPVFEDFDHVFVAFDS